MNEIPHKPLEKVVVLLPKQVSFLIKKKAHLMFSLLCKLDKEKLLLPFTSKRLLTWKRRSHIILPQVLQIEKPNHLQSFPQGK